MYLVCVCDWCCCRFRRRIVSFLLPGEDVLTALRRLGASNNSHQVSQSSAEVFPLTSQVDWPQFMRIPSFCLCFSAVLACEQSATVAARNAAQAFQLAQRAKQKNQRKNTPAQTQTQTPSNPSTHSPNPNAQGQSHDPCPCNSAVSFAPFSVRLCITDQSAVSHRLALLCSLFAFRLSASNST